jgi:glycosyltransferase involved in cell wall biosynthesis
VDIFISNSYSEGLQVSPMEAIASGCYCLLHEWDGADELLPAENLYLTDQELVEKIIHYSQQPEQEKTRLKALQRERVCRLFNLDEIKVQLRQMVEAVAEYTAA